MTDSRQAIQAAAFRLFSAAGYESTSVDDIASEAGVSRSTFFRLFGSKEAVIFPDHDRLISLVRARLEASSAESAIAAVSDAVRLVLFHYVAEGEQARDRYRLTSTVDALRQRELISGARYQRLFRQFIDAQGDRSLEAHTRAELMASAVVAGHNMVLRRWLRREVTDPQVEIDSVLAKVRQLFDPRPKPDTAILVVHEGVRMEDVVDSLRIVAGTPPISPGDSPLGAELPVADG